MIPQKPETVIQQQVVAEAPIKEAFRIFTEKFDLIKPREHNLLSVDIAETVFEARVGGSIYDRVSMEAHAVSLASLHMNRLIGLSSHGISILDGRSRRI